ncbi:hypothetical protein [Bradyrhizobium sp. MOS003]|jgi:hypothetical protein|uniref:hypothetical protein n=1 Tax=Bradyrhizobium sp. MOS003 TaxID=2133946 RepID=UPI001314DBEA|nr:hypothetical protein [Bradyrhizobium sp. MOS003]
MAMIDAFAAASPKRPAPIMAMRVDRGLLKVLNDLQRPSLPRVSPHVLPASKMQIEP